MNQFPAIAIGGPPHSGKSVLTYSLTQLLRDQHIEHYVLRACPDGEGDWSNESPPATVQLLRRKGAFTETFIQHVYQSIQNRHLPLLVDVGGRPTAEQEVILAHCTHIVLVSADEEGLAVWREIAQRNELPILAELSSSLSDTDHIYAEFPILRARIHGLERYRQAEGEVLQRLAWTVRSLFLCKPGQIREIHLKMAPTELAVDLQRVAQTLALAPDGEWRPSDIPSVLAYLPAAEPIAIYGRGANWLYAALAGHAQPAAFFQFDPRLGWVKMPTLRVSSDAQPSMVHWQIAEQADAQQLEMHISDTYIDFDEVNQLQLPSLPSDKGLVISGKLPLWLLTGVVCAYIQHAPELPFISAFQPQVGNVIVAARQPSHAVGDLWPPVATST